MLARAANQRCSGVRWLQVTKRSAKVAVRQDSSPRPLNADSTFICDTQCIMYASHQFCINQSTALLLAVQTREVVVMYLTYTRTTSNYPCGGQSGDHYNQFPSTHTESGAEEVSRGQTCNIDRYLVVSEGYCISVRGGSTS